MEPSVNLKEFEELYLQVCKTLKQCGVSIPARKNFYRMVKKFNELMQGHQTLLNAIGKL